MINEKEKTAHNPSVGADERQSDQMTNNSIPSFDAEINHQIDNFAERLRECEG